jgi:hypothetical protein
MACILSLIVLGMYLKNFEIFNNDFQKLDTFKIKDRNFTVYYYLGNTATNEAIQFREVIGENSYNIASFEGFNYLLGREILNDSTIKILLQDTIGSNAIDSFEVKLGRTFFN